MLPERNSDGAKFDPHHVRWQELSVPRLMVLSSCLSVVENAVFYPFFLLKTKEQVDRTITTRLGAFELTKQQLRGVLKNDGFKGLYKGYWSCSLGYVPSYAIYIMTYIYAKDALGWDPTSSSPWKTTYVPSLAGLIAEGASIGASVPVDVVVQKIQADGNKYRGGMYAVKKVIEEEGVRALYRGAGATLVLYGLASSVWWAVYERSKVIIGRRFPVTPEPHQEGAPVTSPPWKNHTRIFASGYIAGTITSIVCNPLDVVKTRLQVGVPNVATPAAVEVAAGAPQIGKENLHRPPDPNVPTRYKNLLHGFRVLYQEEGIYAFARGLGPKLASKGFLSAITSMTFELVLYFSRKREFKGSDTRWIEEAI